MLKKFDGCDGGDPGSLALPSIWLFGIEPGYSKRDSENSKNNTIDVDDGYSIGKQLTWPFNRSAFKLLAAINGDCPSQFREFAERHQPFVRGSNGYFKGNLYPYASPSVDVCPEDLVQETGFQTKSEYQKWCKEYRWPEIKKWVDEHQPRLFIGVGTSFKEDFALAVFGRNVELEHKSFVINKFKKNIYLANEGWRKLVVIPHLSGGINGLNSYLAIEKAGSIIKELLIR